MDYMDYAFFFNLRQNQCNPCLIKIIYRMKSILENRPGLAKEVNKVAEVAGYLWQKGWAERNGGNITVNITEFVDDEIRSDETDQ